ncbi:MAG TPA: ABC transporter transmembrane domain-containing protein [Vicinamibacterales bacterium]|nr:ABC transporter transmembrane domain-containing protein [Vicinamibacterales bacterium]
MTEFLRLVRYAAPYRGRLVIALLAMLVYAAGSLGVVMQVEPIFNNVLPSAERVGQVAALLLGAYLLKGVGAYVSGYLMTWVGQRVVKDLRTRLYRHILDQSAAFFSRRTSGQLMSRITNDVAQVQQAVSETLADLVRESLAVFGYAGWLFYVDWRLALVCLTAAPLVVYPLTQLGQRVRRMTRRSQQELEHLTHVAAEGLTGHRIGKAFGAEAREGQRFSHAADRLFRTTMRVVSAVAALPPLMEIVGGVAAVLALWYGSRQVAAGDLTTGEFASFLTAAFMMYAPIKKLSRVNAGLQQAIAASQRIFGLLDTHTEVLDKPGAPPLEPLRRSVEFRDVGFAYDDAQGQFTLRHVSFEARANQVVAIVGLSGAGKTTLVNLIPRFYDVTEGAILIDDVDIRDVSLASLRSQIALVTQETVLFDDTIAANIAYGVPDASVERIEAAARAAHAHEFVTTLPDGYRTRIGERGQRLSGGQRQRLAIARAILKDSPLLVLDEATSSLDAESELLVQDALANLIRDRTTFVIAHRLSTVRRADLIVALDEGRVAETGTHESLVGLPEGVYAKLYALQAFEDPAEAKQAAQVTGRGGAT